MKFYLKKKRKRLRDFFKSREVIEVSYRRTLGSFVGFGNGYVSHVEASDSLTERGEVKEIIKALERGARQRSLNVPFGLSQDCLDYLERKGYEVRLETGILSSVREFRESKLEVTRPGRFRLKDK